MKRTFQGVLAGSFGLLLTAIPAVAHHTIAAEFDTRDTVALTGLFTKIEWISRMMAKELWNEMSFA